MRLITEKNQYFLIRMRKNRTIYVKKRKSNAFAEAFRRKGKIFVPVTYRGKKNNKG